MSITAPEGGDGRCKAVTASRNRSNQAVVRGITERFANRKHVVREVGLLDDGVSPHRVQQLFFREQPASVFHQHQQEVECLRRHGNGFPIAEHQALFGDERHVAELPARRGRADIHDGIIPCSRFARKRLRAVQAATDTGHKEGAKRQTIRFQAVPKDSLLATR